MYTGGVVRFRSFALALALLVAATPVIGVVCAMDCDRSLATWPPCHDEPIPHDGITLRAAHHACDHDHTGGRPALLISPGRDPVGISVAAPALMLAVAILPEAHAATACALHGPPGLTARSTSSLITVLRI
jgi:hypothetical protein